MTDEIRSRADAGAPAPEAVAPKPKKPRRRTRTACFIGLLIGLAGLAAGRAGALWIDFDVFAQFTLQFGLIAIACFFGMFMRARGVISAALIVIGYIGIGLWPHIASDRAASLSPAQPGSQQLKLMSFNASLHNFDVEAVAAEIQRNDPDIVVLIESGSEKREVFDRLREQFPHQVNCLDIVFCDMAVLAKSPVASNEAHVLWRGPPVIRVTFGPELNGLTIYGVHTSRFPYQRVQLTQLIELAKFVDRAPGERVVMGDFNSTPYSRLLQTFQRNSGLQRLTFLPTWPAILQLPQLDIDHIFISSGLAPAGQARIGKSAGSDHYPVIATISISTP